MSSSKPGEGGSALADLRSAFSPASDIEVDDDHDVASRDLFTTSGNDITTEYTGENPTNSRHLSHRGRVHDLPIEYMWTKFKEWSDIYGPIYRTQMLGANFIIISDEKVAEDILVKRAKIFSDRPSMRSLFDSKSKT